MMIRRKTASVGAALAATALLASACSGGGGDGGGSTAGGGDGKVEIVGAQSGSTAEALQAELAALSEELGIEVTYTTIPDFDTVIQTRVQGNDAPDIALFPQPGVMFDLAESGDLAALDDVIDVDAIGAAMIPGLADIVTKDGKTYGLPASINVKSLVWVPAAFEENSYTVPADTDELLALTEQIKADGTPPWCFAFEAGAATGWYITDWIEEYVLRIGGPEFYDQWINHEVPFNDPIVKQAAEAFEELVLTPGNAVLSPQAMAATPWGDGMQPLVADPPGCFLARQGNFITGFWPEEVQADLPSYVDTFLFPPYPGGFDGQAVMGGGDIFGTFNPDDPDVKTVLEAIYTPEFGQEWAKGGQYISPFPDFPADAYTDPSLADIAQQVSTADTFRFDGSDMMPGQVGSGSFWTEMTAWVTGQTDLDTALQNIENTWPTS